MASPRVLPHPSPISPFLSFTTPLTRASLNSIRTALAAYTSPPADPAEAHAAVLIPLCNVAGQPGILLEVRGKLRIHAGEVR